MPEFSYRAFNSLGKKVSGKISANDKKSALALLAKQSLKVAAIYENENIAQSEAKSDTAAVSGTAKLALPFFEKLNWLCRGAMPVADAVKSLSLRALNKNLAALCRAIYKKMSEGETLSNALASFPKIFDNTIIHLLQAGESSNNLVPIFADIIDYLKEKKELKAKLAQAAAYPLFLIIMAFSVVLFFLFYMLPKIESMMENMGGELSLPVKILMWGGNFALVYGPFVLIAAFAVFLAVKTYSKTESGKIVCGKYALKIPLIGRILQCADLCKITGLCSILFGSSVNTTETFRLVEKAISNPYIAQKFRLCRAAINDGAAISTALKKYEILSDEDLDIISVGEKTGSLKNSFSELRKLQYETMNLRIKTAITLLASSALASAFFLVFLIALGIVSSVMNLSQSIMAK